ncbi:MAG: transposase [Desulfobulbus sp.]|nr:MAG: transposase [Desulfobulbus sp.]
MIVLQNDFWLNHHDTGRNKKKEGVCWALTYKSILCQEDAYFLELVRYIHLNPLRAKLVQEYIELQDYPYCGHSAVVGKVKREWQDVDSVLSQFGARPKAAQEAYRLYVQDGIAMGRRRDLVGGGLIRSHGGWSAVQELRRKKEFQKGDERILGDSDFVDGVLRHAGEKFARQHYLQTQGVNFEQLVDRVADLFEIPPAEVLAGGKKRKTVAARSLLCFWSVSELGLSQAGLSAKLKIS